MKVESKLFLFLVAFFGVVSVIYLISSFVVYGHVEPIGQTVFVLSFGMAAMIAFYLWHTGRKVDVRPEDVKTAEIADGAGALGFYPPKSIWPFWSAVVAAILLLGPVFGWWITALGAVLGIWAVTGWCYEYYVGEYRH